jgi:hypothetical protein
VQKYFIFSDLQPKVVLCWYLIRLLDLLVMVCGGLLQADGGVVLIFMYFYEIISKAYVPNFLIFGRFAK